MSILDKVKLNPKGSVIGGQRRLGFINTTQHEIEATLGPAHWAGDETKIRVMWFLETPAGRVTVHDYWSNDTEEYTLASTDEQAVMYALEWFAFHNIDGNLDEPRGGAA